MFMFLRPLRIALRALLTESTPRQLSWGLALGVLIGLVPKGNLLAIVLGMCLAATRVNLALAAAAAVAVTFMSSLVDPLSDRLGSSLLSSPILQGFWTRLYNVPVMPWTRFNNSVVLGSFVIGVVLAWPLHRATLPLFEKYAARVSAVVRRWWLVRVLLGAELADRVGSVE